MKKTTRWMALLLSCFLLLGMLSGCKQPVTVESGAAEQDYPVEVCGVQVSQEPEKVAVLSESLADVVLALGYETRVIAVTEECTQTAYATLERVNVNDPATIQNVSPDLVLADASMEDGTKTALQDAGLKVAYVSAPTDRSSYEKMYAEVASMFEGASTGYNNGVAVAGDVCQTLDDIERIIPDNNGVLVTAAIVFDLEGNAVTGDMFYDSVMTSAGLSNVFSGQTGGTYDPAMLKTLNPSFVFCPESGADTLMSDSNYAGMTAVKQKHVVKVTDDELQRMGRTVVSLAASLAGAAYPELLEEQSTDPTTSIGQETSSQTGSETEYATLQAGDENNTMDDVYKMQARLHELGFLTVEYDGYFGSVTEEAVIAFQEKNGLEGTGIADNKTLQLLYSDAAKGAND